MAITFLFVYDYFPGNPFLGAILKGVLIALILGLFLLSLIFKKYRNTSNQEVLNWQIFMTIYILFLMGLLTILGGQSSSGIAFDNGFLWVVLFIALFEIYLQWKKVKKPAG